MRTEEGGTAEGRTAGARAADARLDGVRRMARLLDAAIEIPGTGIRIGIDPLLGLVPGIGDAAATVLGAYILVAGWRLGAPASVLARLALNLAVDAAVGAIPVLGDLFDFGYRANLRNAALLERWLAEPAGARRSSRAAMMAVLIATALVVAALAWSAISVAAWALRGRGP